MARGTFFFPGPTEVRQEVLESMLRQPIAHRSAEFPELSAEVQDGAFGVHRYRVGNRHDGGGGALRAPWQTTRSSERRVR